MSLKHVVIVAADFAPSSLPPSLRIRFFASHLPEFGWEPTIITTDPKHYELAVDYENERLIPPMLSLIRTNAFPVNLTRKVGLGDLSLRSLWFHWQAMSRLFGRQKIDLVFISVPPYYSMLLGRLAYLRFHIPYVVDYIDPWVRDSSRNTSNSMRPPKERIADALARILEPISIKNAAHIVGVSQKTTEMVISRYPQFHFSDTDTSEIPYGGEISDFEYLAHHPRRNIIFDPQDGRIHLSYVGTFNLMYHPAAQALFQAIKLGLGREPELFQKVWLHFVGTTYAPVAQVKYQVMSLAEEAGLLDFVDEHPARVSYLDSLQLLLDSHALIALGSDTIHYTASKIFPYILARKQILAIYRAESSVVDIVENTKAGSVVKFTSLDELQSKVEEIYPHLRSILRLPQNHTPQTQWGNFEQYTTRAMTQRLAHVFDAVVKVHQNV